MDALNNGYLSLTTPYRQDYEHEMQWMTNVLRDMEGCDAVSSTRQGLRGSSSQIGTNPSRTTMSGLFPDLPEELSPRLKWMLKKNIKTIRRDDGKWVAFKSETRFNNSDENEVDAVIGLAKKLKLKLWNE